MGSIFSPKTPTPPPPPPAAKWREEGRTATDEELKARTDALKAQREWHEENEE